jgi:hypothetical protein
VQRLKWRENISYALTGWISGVVSTILIGLAWPIIFPAIVNVEHYYGVGPGLFTIIGIVLVVITIPSLIGGLIGSRVSIEGGANGQRIFAALFGVILATPFTCMGLWFFTGF